MTQVRRRASLRLGGYDYTTPGAYFVTICSHRKSSLFSSLNTVQLVTRVWNQIPQHFQQARVDQFVVMPNHVHGIIWLVAPVGAQHAAPLRNDVSPGSVLPGSLSAVVRSFKAAVTRELRTLSKRPDQPIWQRNYYERVVRNEDELNRVREYIHTNPDRWRYDRENPLREPNPAHDQAWSWLEGEPD